MEWTSMTVPLCGLTKVLSKISSIPTATSRSLRLLLELISVLWHPLRDCSQASTWAGQTPFQTFSHTFGYSQILDGQPGGKPRCNHRPSHRFYLCNSCLRGDLEPKSQSSVLVRCRNTTAKLLRPTLISWPPVATTSPLGQNSAFQTPAKNSWHMPTTFPASSRTMVFFWGRPVRNRPRLSKRWSGNGPPLPKA